MSNSTKIEKRIPFYNYSQKILHHNAIKGTIKLKGFKNRTDVY